MTQNETNDAFRRAFERLEIIERQLSRIDGELELVATEMNVNKTFRGIENRAK
jgi:hypothetical protein